ncbi:metacaspase-1-like isoform X2 [Lotus japonicus]|uniref:metacaspase-1-like isoform X2 n=1 Tax=Lotus japonicus TaxID=34305 RepID=UPI00258FBB90|nr:metacaspase-1-like isoform X2 [Lotus japonicus]
MRNTRLNIISQPNQEADADAISNTKPLELQFLTSSIQNIKALINNPGNVSGNGNGSFYLHIQNVNVHHPGHTAPSRPLRPPSAYGHKRAVLFGINYGNTAAPRLKGSVNNAQCMKDFLINKLGFPGDSIWMFTDDSEEKTAIPTKHNMRVAMKWLVEDCQAGDSLVFYFSGQVARVKDHNGDELDGCDEAICPVDYEDEGKIRDDEINTAIVRPLPHGAKLHALVDASFSGTILDLQFVYTKMNWIGYWGWKDHRPRRGDFKGSKGGLAVCISACGDNAISADKSALTQTFIQAMQDAPKLTYGSLLDAMRSTIYSAKAGKFVRDILQQYAHEPQLSSSEKFNIHSKLILM